MGTPGNHRQDGKVSCQAARHLSGGISLDRCVIGFHKQHLGCGDCLEDSSL